MASTKLHDGVVIQGVTGEKLWLKLNDAVQRQGFKRALKMPSVEQCERWAMSINGTGRYDRIWSFAPLIVVRRSTSKSPGTVQNKVCVPCRKYNVPGYRDLQVVCEMIRDYIDPERVVLYSERHKQGGNDE